MQDRDSTGRFYVGGPAGAPSRYRSPDNSSVGESAAWAFDDRRMRGVAPASPGRNGAAEPNLRCGSRAPDDPWAGLHQRRLDYPRHQLTAHQPRQHRRDRTKRANLISDATSPFRQHRPAPRNSAGLPPARPRDSRPLTRTQATSSVFAIDPSVNNFVVCRYGGRRSGAGIGVGGAAPPGRPGACGARGGRRRRAAAGGGVRTLWD
jgi:hypothetical protein